MYNAAGIDVSKGKSAAAALQHGGVVIRKPFDVPHTSKNLSQFSEYPGTLNSDTKIVMECTGRHHDPMADDLHKVGLFVSIVNPHLIKNFGNNSLRKVKKPTNNICLWVSIYLCLQITAYLLQNYKPHKTRLYRLFVCYKCVTKNHFHLFLNTYRHFL